MQKKLLSLLLAVAMVVCMVPSVGITAMATEDVKADVVADENKDTTLENNDGADDKNLEDEDKSDGEDKSEGEDKSDSEGTGTDAEGTLPENETETKDEEKSEGVTNSEDKPVIPEADVPAEPTVPEAPVLMAAPLAAPLAAEPKAVTVGEGETYTAIQDTIDAIAKETDPTGWTITVKAGTYDRFTVNKPVSGLTIVGENGAVINVLENDNRFAWDNGGINIWAPDITLKNLKVVAGESKKAWADSAISTNNGASGGSGNSLTVENCTVVGPGVGKGSLYGIFWNCDRLEVKNSTISGFSNAIEFMLDGYSIPEGETFEMNNNTFSDCSFAIHGYMGGNNGAGTLEIANNTITGTDALRAKVIVQDNATNTLKTNIHSNTFANVVVGTVNLQDAGDKNDVLKENTLGKGCFYVDAIEPGTIEFYTNYMAPEAGAGYWKLNNKEGLEQIDYINKQIADANAKGEKKLSITGIDKDHLVKTFTWFKDALYWETLESGSFKVTKEVIDSANPDAANAEYNFKATIIAADGKSDALYTKFSGTLGGLTFTDGVANFTLKAGESVTATNVPVGVRVMVEEVVEEGAEYAPSYVVNGQTSPESGVIVVASGTVAEVKVTNKWKAPIVPVVPEKPDWTVSKSKTATNLDKNFESKVTLGLPSYEQELVSDIVFVLDKSTSAEVEGQALAMLTDLKGKIANTGAKVKVGVVIFNKIANVTEFKDLATEYDAIEAAITEKISSGTNTHAGMLAGKAMLDADKEVEASRKHLIFVSDGVTYMFNENPTAEAWSFDADGWKNWAGPDNWNTKYGNNNAPKNWGKHLGAIRDQVKVQGTQYEYPYGGTVTNSTPKDDTSKQYVNSIDKALYYTYNVYNDCVKAGYNCYAMVANQNRGTQYKWGPSFMDYLAENSCGKDVTFDKIEKEIYYLLDAGSEVVDVIGKDVDEKGNEYDFAFIPEKDKLQMKVGGKVIAVKDITGEDKVPHFGFGELHDNGKYDYELKYYANGTEAEADEHFVWEINVPVTNFERVELTYTVKLTNPQKKEGTYGEYDKDGSNDRPALYTNNSATLYPVDTNGKPGDPEEFDKPTVSYEVKNHRPRPTPEDDDDDEEEKKPRPYPIIKPEQIPSTGSIL